MELKQIKDLMNAMGRTGTRRLKIVQEGFEIELEREPEFPHDIAHHVAQVVKSDPFLTDIEHHRVSVSPSRIDRQHQDDEAYVESEKIGQYVTSPMVGTFYASPSPENESFVKVGDTVDADIVICIIEAMKVMNEVKAGVSVTVAEVLMENGHPVEVGTNLFHIV